MPCSIWRSGRRSAFSGRVRILSADLRDRQKTTGDPDLVAIDGSGFDVMAGRHHEPDDYTASQALAQHLQAEGANGIVYRSVRWSAQDLQES